MIIKKHDEGWVSIDLTKIHEKVAKEIRAERDSQYGNVYKEKVTDQRWVGDVGEIVFNLWLQEHNIENFVWITKSSAGKSDFVINDDIDIGVKTVKRKGPPKNDYTAQITAKHIKEPADYFFFMSYEIALKRMWLLGGITKELFKSNAKYYGAGDWVHPNYQVREGHEIYNVNIAKLTPPTKWIGFIQ